MEIKLSSHMDTMTHHGDFKLKNQWFTGEIVQILFNTLQFLNFTPCYVGSHHYSHPIVGILQSWVN